MAIDTFLKVEGVTGESNDSNHKNWTDVLSFTWGASQQGNMAVGGGGGSGKVNYRDLQIQALIDKSTPSILKFCSSGKHVNKVEISICKAGGSQVEYSRIVLEEVLVTLVEFAGVGHTDTIVVNYRFQAAKVTLHYWEQTEQGTKGAETQSGWDIKQNKEI
ncbi:type VI secretion system tube protein Hcp [Erwiniaceae bacterium L1_54_6]|jgi:type VI secretion system secreted protein Hcp|uniref:Type VI secretion system tube protein Hcp n=1 Tax=Pantoea cypripedii TaxID=55209 RepID=A0A6B9G3I0_PANCY|nr:MULTISPECIES: type VI secretion system tube protein Hcp [Pantoea]MDE1189175.1 type VI secretion system tube protein Hcp [Pantoea sp.]MDF7662637.1 type VI secretion system tube protein Hcp [Erwiniaceae bacterium L1_54_6]QGY32074.1 type VI secretion system tube protein Hcp [Pantoea cypripedii]